MPDHHELGRRIASKRCKKQFSKSAFAQASNSVRRIGEANHSHPIPIGTTVIVIGMNDGPFIEGRATIKAIVSGAHRYRVQFSDDPALRVRIVHPALQEDPEEIVRALQDLWQAGISVDDFFPESNRPGGT